MLAYVFWHRPRAGTDVAEYEQAQLAFHASLRRTPPAGMRGSVVFRVQGLPWLEPAGDGESAYEDWYLLEDYAALGVLGEAAVGHGHRTAHDRAASAYGIGAGGLYGLVEGSAEASPLEAATLAAWVAREPGAPRRELEDLLADGIDPRQASLWRRQLVLGPAPEFCLLSREPAPGTQVTRLPAGWSSQVLERTAL